LRIEVHDTGVGMPPDKLASVFRTFYRLDSTQPNGLGLGLLVVRRAVDLPGHRVDVCSTLGRGSCFVVVAKGAAAPRPSAHVA
jgi:two-component system, OmpR family, phosphate regulon sensor histidine kinase PhoR